MLPLATIELSTVLSAAGRAVPRRATGTSRARELRTAAFSKIETAATFSDFLQ